MKTLLSSSYSPTFTPGVANAGTLNFSSAVTAVGFDFRRIQAVIDLSSNSILFAPGSSATGGSWNSGTSVLTLSTNTSNCYSGDYLEVYWDDPKATIVIDAPNPAVPVGWPSKYHLVTTVSTNISAIKTSGGTIGCICVFSNPQAASTYYSYLKIFDKASAPTLGTDIPIMVAPYYTSTPQNVISIPGGIKMNNGIAIAVTGGVADSDSSPAIAGHMVDIFYS